MARLMKRPRTAFFGSLISPCPQSNPSWRATGPFSQQYGVHAWVDASGRRKFPSFIASTYASSSGMNSGGHPAITPFTATCRTVTPRCTGGIAPSECSGSKSVKRRNSATAFSVGGTIGKPSVQPESRNICCISANVPETVWFTCSTTSAILHFTLSILHSSVRAFFTCGHNTLRVFATNSSRV